MKDLTALAREGTVAFKSDVKGSLSQLSKSTEHNKSLQAAVNSASNKSVEASSGLTNPFRVHEGEKYDLMEKIRDRVRATYRETADVTLGDRLQKGLVQFALVGGFVDALKTLEGVSGQVAAIAVKLGQLKSFGWKLFRLTDAWSNISKMFTVTAETIIRHEAPMVHSAAIIHATDAHVVTATSDIHAVVTKDEIHRVADAFGLDAKYLTALLSAAATLHAQGKIDLASAQDFEASSLQNLKLKGGLSLKLSSPSHTITDGAGGTISMSAGVINLNPVVSAPSDPPTVVAPVVNVTADGWIREVDAVGQYEGVNGHGSVIF